MASYSDAAETFQPTYRHPSMFVKVDGVRHMPGATREILQSLPKLKTRYDDVIIATWPKSGTTWTMEIVWQIFHDGEISEARIDERVNFLELLFMPTDPANKKTPDDVSEAFEGLPAPRLLKTHLSYGVIPNGEGQTEKPNIILVLRNPKDTVVSYYHHYTGIGILDCDCDWDEFFEHFMNGNLVFGSWFDYMREFWPHRNDSNLLILKYEDMKKPKEIDCSGLLLFSFSKFINKEEIGHGAFGAVFTADLVKDSPERLTTEKVVIKKVLSEDLEDKKNFVKEARILQALQHNNIVGFKGICSSPFALVLEYVYFDFTPFGGRTKVSTLAEFVSYIDCFDCEHFDSPHVFKKISKDVATALCYLHGKKVAHRDLKPANILVSNQHYFDKSSSDVEKAWEENPIMCKLADFGESRSSDVQTGTILRSQTSRVNRGTPVYMAPEILVGDTRLHIANFEDLKKADVWAFGMTLFVLLNPGVKYPYRKELEDARNQGKSVIEKLELLLKKQQLPMEPQKYQHKHASVWFTIHEIFKACVKFDPNARPDVADIISMTEKEVGVSSMDIHLRVSQASSVEACDSKVAKHFQEKDEVPAVNLQNDGTNACAFLSVKIAHEIYKLQCQGKEKSGSVWWSICNATEKVITELPREINAFREIDQLYDVLTAYSLMRKNCCSIDEYNFSEEFLTQDYVFSLKGRMNLLEVISSMAKKEFCVAIYTCEPIIFIIGHITDSIFILDTHPIAEAVGGQGKGILKVFPYADEEGACCTGVCLWLWQRLLSSGIRNESYQSLSLMTKISRNAPVGINSNADSTSMPAPDYLADSQDVKGRTGFTTEDLAEESGSQDNERNNQGLPKCQISGSDPKSRIDTNHSHKRDDRAKQSSIEISSHSEDDDISSGKSVAETKRKYVSDDEFSPASIHQRSKRVKQRHQLEVSLKGNEYVTEKKRKESCKSPSQGEQKEQRVMINGYPVYKVSDRGLSTKEIINICCSENVPAGKVCKTVPQGVTETAVFVIDLTDVETEDLTADGNGIYKRHSSPTEVVRVEFGSDKSVDVLTVRNVEKIRNNKVSKGGEVFIVKRHYSWHHSSQEFCRIVTKVQGKGNIGFKKYAVIQYKVTGKAEIDFHRKKHGNAKKVNESYIRTKPTVMSKMKEYVEDNSPKRVISKVQTEAGGVADAASVSDLPRNRKQVYNLASKMPNRIRSRCTGPQKAPEYGRLITKLQANDFLKDVSFGVRTTKGKEAASTTPNTFASKDVHLQWLKTFCSGTSPKSQCGIDMTYKCGPFYLTTLTFPHPMFVGREARRKHPTVLAGIMTSVRRECEDYEYLASNLKRKGITSLTYGTDGETPLEQGFEKIFPIEGVSSNNINIHLRCFDHVRTDMCMKLKSLKIEQTSQKQIIREALGSEYEGKRVMGLVDCGSSQEFDSELELAEKNWPKEFNDWLHISTGRLRPLTETMRKCMLKPVRVAAGLGNPPNKWHNQRTESLNNVIKEELQRKVTDQDTIHDLIEERVIKPQLDEMVKAIYSVGEYRLADEYRHLAVDPMQWSQMTHQQRDARIKRVFGVALPSSRPDDVITHKLSVALTDCQLQVSFPSYQLKDIWRRAEIILSNYTVMELPNENFCVVEYDKSYNVETVNGHNLICKSCKCFMDTNGLCPHVLVVAEKTKNLRGFLTAQEKSTNKLGKIIKANLPKQLGEKPQQQKKPRRGKNNVAEEPIEIEVDTSDLITPKPARYTEYYQNDEPFYIVFVQDYKRAKKCTGCNNAFPRRMPIAPYDIAILHEERYLYPKKNDKGNVHMATTYVKKASRLYCVDKKCILSRHPYFWRGLLKVTTEVKERLKKSHKELLYRMLRYCFDQQ